MRPPGVIPDSVRELQRAVSNPAVSAWVAANAGSGKTHVLVAARDQPFARRRRAGKNPLHHLHQGRRRQHGEAGVRHARRMDHARRCRPRQSHWRAIEPQARRRAPRAGAALVRARARHPGRPQGAHHPRFLHPAPASVPVRGQCRRALQRARRRRAHPASRAIDAQRAARRRRRARRQARPRAGRGDGRGGRSDVPRRCTGSNRQARHDHDRGRPRHSARQSVEIARRRSVGRRSKNRSRVFYPLADCAGGMAGAGENFGGGQQDRHRAGAAFRWPRGAAGRRTRRQLSANLLYRRRHAAEIHRHQGDQRHRPGGAALPGAGAHLRVARPPPRRGLPRPQRSAAHHRL